MITADLPGIEDQKPELSEESEEEILRMVEEQLDRPNPPDTKVLYRRAMHFVDRDVRHLSLQQFNAKFPLRVKRRRAMSGDAGNGAPEASATDGVRTTNGHHAETSKPSTDSQVQARTPSGSEKQTVGQEEVPAEDVTVQRERVRSALLDYARQVASAESKSELVETAPRVDEYVERVLAEG